MRYRLWSYVTGWVAVLLGGVCFAQAQDWELVWSDEFDGPGIDLNKWEHEVNAWGGGNNELQYYTDRPVNSFIEDGKLVIQALQETYTGPEGTRDYTSARLRTLHKGEWLYGRFEARIKLPTGQGLWPAFWMLPTDWVYGGWAASGEIDVVELIGSQPGVIHGTLHYGGEWPNNTLSGGSRSGPDFTAGFHEYAVEWDPLEFRWYVDGVHYHTETDWWSSAADYPAPFNQRFHMLLNVAVGGNWPGSPDASTVFPQRMEVDYVRVYQRTADLGPSKLIRATGSTRVEAENYGLGGQGVGYYDSTPGNTGGAYRSDDVDIEVTIDEGGGYNVGWMVAGEWLAYPMEVEAAGFYTVAFRVASQSGGAFRLRNDGGPALTGQITVPATGGWQTWTTVVQSNVFLAAGEQVLTFHADTSGFNFNWMHFIAPAPGLDTDGDGISDAWEVRYTGNPTGMVAHVDSDGDGFTYFAEYIADTDPTNAQSRLIMTGVTLEDDMVFNVWPASTARVYRLQRYTHESGVWSNLLTGIVPTDVHLSITNSPTEVGVGFYQIGVSLPE